MPSKVEVQVRFYKILWDNGEGGKKKKYLSFDPVAHLKALKAGIASSDNKARDSDLREVGAYDISVGGERPWLKIGRVQRHHFPSVEEKDSTLAVLNTNGKPLVDATHLVFFPDNIIGAEFNYRAPRPTNALPTLLRVKVPDGNYDRLRVTQLVRADVRKQLESGVRDLVALEFGFELSDVPDKSGVTVVDAVKSGGTAIGADRVTVRFAVNKDSRIRTGKAAAQAIANSDALYEVARTLKVEAKTAAGDFFAIDLLRGHIVGDTTGVLEDETGSSLESKSAVKAITGVYEQLKDEIKQAISIVG